jgi:Protein of unknown function (DUF732)
MIGVEMFKTMLVTLAGVVAAISLGAGVAQAHTDNGPFSGPQGDRDASAYWVDVNPFGSGSVTSASRLANTICSKLADGFSEGRLIAVIAQTPDTTTAVSDATFIVHAAEWHFCPTYY